MKLRIVGLDFLRFIFSLLICAFHFFEGENWIDWAWVATNFFFMLSGFVLYEQVNSKSQDFAFYNFIIKRMARIYPTLIFCLLLRLILAVLEVTKELYSGQSGKSSAFAEYFPVDYLLTFFLLQFIFPVTTALITPLWSLAAEYWVSLVVFLMAGFRSTFRISLGIVLGLTMILFSGYLFNNGFMDWSTGGAWCFGVGRVVLFFFVGALMRSKSQYLLRASYTCYNLAIILSLALSIYSWLHFKSGFLIPSSVFFISLVSISFKIAQFRDMKRYSLIGDFLAKISFPIFALHILIYYPTPFIEELTGKVVSFIILTSFTCIISAFFVKYIEKRIANVFYKFGRFQNP